jgi:NhaP-type Na+/H+ or K+/H+ antiporter
MNRAASEETRSEEQTFKTLQRLFLYLGGLIVSGQMFFLMEYTWDVQLHSAIAYIAMAIALPLVFAMLSQASHYKWAATTTAAVYMIIAIAEILIFPLFPAQPKLGPVFNPVTHLIPGKFPILIFVPALGLDLLWQKTSAWRPWKVALVSGFLFIAVLTIVEWPFARFLLSKASENRFFGTIYFEYNSRPNDYDRLRQFFQPDHGLTLYWGLLRAAIYGSISTWIGLSFGRWMRSVQR